ELGVVVGVEIDEAGGHPAAGRVDVLDLFGIRGLGGLGGLGVGLEQRDDPPFADQQVTLDRRRTKPVEHHAPTDARRSSRTSHAWIKAQTAGTLLLCGSRRY